MCEEYEEIATEQCGSTGERISIVKNNNEILYIPPKTSFFHNFRQISYNLKDIVLPVGYPESVSADYLEYQLWDTLQAFCSTIIGAFKTRAILKGVGVGNSAANALSAATTWILKDGIGMFGRIVFTWWKGSGLDCECKKWRYFADILNDFAMIIELCLPFYAKISMPILCITSTMYAIVGIAGGATRASITHHQAIKNNMAEISAKDGTQETVVNLIGSFGSVFLLNYFSSSKSEWILVVSLIIVHLYTNFLAVKSLVFNTFNQERLTITLKGYFTSGMVLNSSKVNEKESVLVGTGLSVRKICGFDIKLGYSLKSVLNLYTSADIKFLTQVYENKKYILCVNGRERRIYVLLEKEINSQEIIGAYFHAVCLGIATSIYNYIELDIYSKRQLHHPTPITRLFSYMKSYEKSYNNFSNIPINYLFNFNEFVEQEHSMFFTGLNLNDWKIDSNCLKIGEYRIEWLNRECNKKSN